MKNIPRTVFFATTLLSALSLQGQTIFAQWTLNGTLSATTTDASLTSASDLTFTGLNSLGYDGIGIEFDGMPASPATTDFVSVTMDAGAGTINLNDFSVTFDADYINGSRTGDGYSVELISDPSGSASTLAIGSSDDAELEFSSGAITGFTPASVVELRVYWNNGQTWGDQQMANLTVLTPVPEPSTFALIFGALALIGVMVRRRLLNK